MNLLLFHPTEWLQPLSARDPRTVHIRKILRSKEGDILSAGIINGPLGSATIEEMKEDGSLLLSFREETDPLPLAPLTLIIGVPRPPTARRLLKDLTTAGIKRIIFCGTDLGEKSYLTSSLWTKEEYKNAILEGVSQGKSTLIPEVDKLYSLYKAIDRLEEDCDRLALDNVSPRFPLREYEPRKKATCLAIGPERGWSDREREMLRERGFTICSMGERVLRTETACHMGLALVQAARKII